MDMAAIVLRQTIVMFLYILCGYTLYKKKIISEAGSKDVASLLVKLTIPAVIVNSFCVEFSTEKLMEFGASAFLGALALLVAMIISKVIFWKNPLDEFGAAFSNASFMGIPLVRATFGEEAVFYLVSIAAILNVLQATYGVFLLTKKKSAVSLKSIMTNPIMVGAILGVLIFVTGLGTRIPGVVKSAVGGLASVNGPLAMVVLGVYLAKSDLKVMVTSGHLYWFSLVRLILIPLATVAVFMVIPGFSSVKISIMFAAAASAGANVAVYAQLNGQDYPYACQTVALSTVLSIISIPAILMAASLVL